MWVIFFNQQPSSDLKMKSIQRGCGVGEGPVPTHGWQGLSRQDFPFSPPVAQWNKADACKNLFPDCSANRSAQQSINPFS